jgi:hypothetical protein
LRLFLYGYMNGVRSSRALERACWVNLELAWLPTPRQQAALGTPSSAGCSPTSRRPWDAGADFRKDNGAAITWTCQAFVRFALSHGLIKGRLVATDGSRFAAASSRRRRQAREDVEAEIAAHEVAIAGYLADLEAADALVDPAEQAAERQRVRKALVELAATAKAKLQALATSSAKKLVVAEPAKAAGHRLFRPKSPGRSAAVERHLRPDRWPPAELQRALAFEWGLGLRDDEPTGGPACRRGGR